MNDDNHKTLQEFAMGEIIKELRAERDALKAELAIANSTGIELLKQKNESAEHILILRKRIDVAEAELEAARKQEPIIIRTMEGFEFLKTYEIGTKLYASPVPAQQPEQCNCIRWKSKTVAFRAYVDQKTYDGFTPEVQKWYEPILTEQLLKGGENER